MTGVLLCRLLLSKPSLIVSQVMREVAAKRHDRLDASWTAQIGAADLEDIGELEVSLDACLLCSTPDSCQHSAKVELAL